MSHTQMIKRLIKKAQEKFPGQILTACGKISSGRIEDSTSRIDDMFVMWFNTPDGSTHIVKEYIKEEPCSN